MARTGKRRSSLEQLEVEKSRNDRSWQNRPSNQLEQVSTGQNGKNSVAKVNSQSNGVIAPWNPQGPQTSVSRSRAQGEVEPPVTDTRLRSALGSPFILLRCH